MPRSAKKQDQKTKKPAATRSKAVTAKSAGKKVGKQKAAKYIAKVPEQNVFWCNDGAVLRDMRELRDALAMMSDETFEYHCNEMKKDFSTWIRDVVGDAELADELAKADNRQDAAKVVEMRCMLLIDQAE